MNNLNIQNVDLNVATKFWGKFGCLLQEEIKRSSNTIQQMLEEDYPKLLKCYYELVTKLNYEPFKYE